MSAIIAPSRALLESLNPARQTHICKCLRILQSKRKPLSTTRRHVSTSTTQRSEMEVEGNARPRWAQTPPAMKAPVPARAKPFTWKQIECNSDPAKLDNIYARFLGPNGDKLLSDETKWLAITHKSYDHGRRGFNDRLAYLGKRIVEVQLSLSLLNAAETTARKVAAQDAPFKESDKYKDPYGREPFTHPAIDNIGILASNSRQYYIHHKAMSKVAQKYDIPSVIRWWPKNPENLGASGCDLVYAQTVFAIVGALALERGSAVANQLTKERILSQLGVRQGMREITDKGQA